MNTRRYKPTIDSIQARRIRINQTQSIRKDQRDVDLQRRRTNFGANLFIDMEPNHHIDPAEFMVDTLDLSAFELGANDTPGDIVLKLIHFLDYLQNNDSDLSMNNSKLNIPTILHILEIYLSRSLLITNDLVLDLQTRKIGVRAIEMIFYIYSELFTYSTEILDFCLKSGVLPLIFITTEQIGLDWDHLNGFFRALTFLISNLSSELPSPKFNSLQECLPLFYELSLYPDQIVLENICKTVSNFTNTGEISDLEILMKSHIFPRLVNIIREGYYRQTFTDNYHNIVHGIVQSLGNIFGNDIDCKEFIKENNLIHFLLQLLLDYFTEPDHGLPIGQPIARIDFITEIIWALSNLVATDDSIISMVLDNLHLPFLINGKYRNSPSHCFLYLFSNSKNDIKLELGWFYANLLTHCSPTIIEDWFFSDPLNSHIITGMMEFLKSTDILKIKLALESLEAICKVYKILEKEYGDNQIMINILQSHEIDLLNILDDLCYHDSEEINILSAEILNILENPEE